MVALFPSQKNKPALASALLIASAFLFTSDAQTVTPGSPCTGNFQNVDQGQAQLNRLAKLYTDPVQWKERKSKVRLGVLTGLELVPLPKRCPLNPVVHSKKTFSGYTRENVIIQTLPGFYLGANLYRPTTGTPPFPAVITTHGHDNSGRFSSTVQYRGGILAKMGAVVLTYDMIGYGDTKQCGHTSNSKAMALEIWDGIRCVDFIRSMPEIDTTRIGFTGESGGGTHTFYTTFFDDRVTADVPVVMVSSYFFGGCVCESGMPVCKSNIHETNNCDIASLAAPRPQLVISDGGDWTANVPKVEFPYIKNVYHLFGQDTLVENLHLANEQHDYGPSKRAGAYRFFAKRFGLTSSAVLKADASFDEGSIPVENQSELQAVNSTHPLPSGALQGDAAVIAALKQAVKDGATTVTALNPGHQLQYGQTLRRLHFVNGHDALPPGCSRARYFDLLGKTAWEFSAFRARENSKIDLPLSLRGRVLIQEFSR